MGELRVKVVILCGGLGTRLSEKTELLPKPMVEIGGRPIVWHIMNSYASQGFNEFVLALGYKSEVVKRYFLDYYHTNVDSSVCLATGKVDVHNASKENWTVHLVDTGMLTQTGGRIRRLAPWLDGETFMLTYGDGVCDVDVNELVRFHKEQKAIATVTAVRPPSRFGGLRFEGDLVKEFIEKPQIGEGWINGGFFVLEPEVFDYVGTEDDCIFEREPLEKLANDGQLVAYRHEGFWQCMDTLRDLRLLEKLWADGTAPWKSWQ